MSVSNIDALNTLATSIPDWNGRLDELNGQIALRQIELARLTEERPPTAKSLRNKGSTESLRPNDQDDNPIPSHDVDKADNIQLNPSESPISNPIGFTSAPWPSLSTGQASTTSPPPKASSNPKPSPSAFTRQSSQPATPAQARISPAALRKRKTDSLASGESLAPKYRTRSMIIVYYDSAVQAAFEDLVKFVSGSRNAMRKGKMAAKMAEMRRAAELEVEGDTDDDNGSLEALETNPVESLRSLPSKPGIPRVANPDEAMEAEDELPIPRFVSSRNMLASKNYSRASGNTGTPLSLGMLKGYKRAGETRLDVFDILDKGLEWCQSQCEHAAHQFLRDGECTTEIENIKKKLIEVKATAEKEVERLRIGEASTIAAPPTKGREFKPVQMRRDPLPSKSLEVDDSFPIEVDDEGVDDMEPPTLTFKRSRDVAR